MAVVRGVLLDVGRASLSGLLGAPDEPSRGLLVALHGGGSRAAYWDSPVDPGSSLVRLGPALGWQVLALDRPGYGASEPLAERRLRAADQVPLVESAVAQVREPGVPVVLVGHSLGGIVAIHAAASGRPAGLIALAVGGVPVRYTPEQTERMDRADTSEPYLARARGPRPDPRNWFGPAGTWDERLLDHRRSLVGPTPSGEYLDAHQAPTLLPPLLSRITVPVQVAAAAHELTSAPGPEILQVTGAALTTAGVVETVLVEHSGHNLSLRGSARAYHLRVLAFAERARVAAALAGARHG
jgi:pimeloyl-ACP methyl ester carboxylesterase